LVKFSKYFGIKKSQAQLDFVDIDSKKDTPLFIDPFAIAIKGDIWSRLCQAHIQDFFETALKCVKNGDKKRGIALLNGLSEPNETCLGLSKGEPAGRGVSGKQAFDLYDNLANSGAAKSGILEDLSEFDLFVDGIAKDKISDITTNIIREHLIDYTIDQCALHNIELVGTYPSGRFWDIPSHSWKDKFVRMPVIRGKKIILVPKYSVRFSMVLNSQEFYSRGVLNFIAADEFEKGSPLVRTLKNGEQRPPTKATLKELHPFSKTFLAEFCESNPRVLENYKMLYTSIEGAVGAPTNRQLEDDFDEVRVAKALSSSLKEIESGTEAANEYHNLIIGILQFIFYPNLIYPKKERPINDGRKRIDISYTNAALSGFFFRVHTAHNIASNEVMVECKNYTKDLKNPEFDQLVNRFSTNRGRLGFLLFRSTNSYELLLKRARDVAQQGNGFPIPLGDDQVHNFLALIAENKRASIDKELELLLRQLL
jgi:hypothetical protein